MRRLAIALMLAFASTSAALAEPPDTHEIIYNRPSGFWTSNAPAIGGAYKYRLLGIGVVVAAIMGFVIVRLIRRANAERVSRW
jgi:hypothetical protein